MEIVSEMNSSASELLKEEYGRMVGYVRKRIQDSTERDAEDIVQDVVYSVFNTADISAPFENLAAYIYQGLRNRIVDVFRTRKKNLSLDSNVGSEDDGLRLGDLIEDITHCPDRDLGRKEASRILYEAIGKLKEDEQKLIIATEIEGYKFQELAEDWNVSINSLLSRKSRAMGKLKVIINRSLMGSSI